MIHHNSKKIKLGDVFLCLPGGEKYQEEALKNGASKIITCTREEMANISNEYFDNPSENIIIIGVTGTNGKTTITYFVHQALQRLGYKSKWQSTINQPLTTPESLDTLRSIKEHAEEGGTHFVMEVSSHGIHQKRLLGINFDIKLLSNISQDHLDYHKTFEEYKRVKLSFMEKKSNSVSVMPENYKAENIPNNPYLLGEFNKDNLRSAKSILKKCHKNEAEIDAVLSKIKAPPGRFEIVENNHGITLLVDYAHTPDALDKVLREAKKLTKAPKSKLISVFGCGGERDRDKRHKMAIISEKYASLSIITLDNPRHESITQITEDIVSGFSNFPGRYTVIDDRKAAIHYAIKVARSGDVVVIAGKGHEKNQIIGDMILPINDKEEALCAFSMMES